jgi:hypothetical protein
MMDDTYYYEKDTGRVVKAKEFIIFDTLVWDVNYIDEPPVHHMYKDVDFKRKFTKENPMEIKRSTLQLTQELMDFTTLVVLNERLHDLNEMLKDIPKLCKDQGLLDIVKKLSVNIDIAYKNGDNLAHSFIKVD